MVLKIETTLFYTYSYFFLGNKQSQPYQQGQQQFARDHSTEIVSDNSDSPTTMSIEKTEVSKNSDGKIVKTTVVISKNGSKITTITEPIIDKPVSDNSEPPKVMSPKKNWTVIDGKTVKTTVVEVKKGTKITTITEPIIDKPVSDNSEPPNAMSGKKKEVIKNSDGKTGESTVVNNKNGSKPTTITESSVDKPVSDNSEDLKSVVCKSGTKVMPTGDVVIFPEFPTWGDFGPSIGGPGIKCQIILNVFLVSSNRPKNQRKFCKDFCPSL